MLRFARNEASKLIFTVNEVPCSKQQGILKENSIFTRCLQWRINPGTPELVSKGKFHHRDTETLRNLALIIRPLCFCASVVKEKIVF